MKSLVKSQGCVVVVVVCKNEKSILNFIWKFQRIQNNQNNLEKEEQSGGFISPDFKTFYKHRVIKTAAAKSLQSCPTLCDPIDGSPPGKNTGTGITRDIQSNGTKFRVHK